jgi:hypothetical protein
MQWRRGNAQDSAVLNDSRPRPSEAGGHNPVHERDARKIRPNFCFLRILRWPTNLSISWDDLETRNSLAASTEDFLENRAISGLDYWIPGKGNSKSGS